MYKGSKPLYRDNELTRIHSGRIIAPLLARGIGAWRSLVAHLLWEQRVGGSNPSAPTKSGHGVSRSWGQVFDF